MSALYWFLIICIVLFGLFFIASIGSSCSQVMAVAEGVDSCTGVSDNLIDNIFSS